MNDFIAKLKAEPTILVQAAQAILGLLVALNVVGFTEAQTGAVLGVVAAASGLLIALTVRPFAWAAVTGFVQAGAVGVAEFGLELTEQQVGAVYTTVAVLGMVLRQFVTPEVKLEPLVRTSH